MEFFAAICGFLLGIVTGFMFGLGFLVEMLAKTDRVEVVNLMDRIKDMELKL